MTLEEQIIAKREEQAKLMKEAREKLDTINDKTPEGEARSIEGQFDDLMKRHAKASQDVERLQTLHKAEQEALKFDKRAPGEDAESRNDEINTPEYREVFNSYVKHGISELSREEREILRNNHNPEVRAQSVGTDSAGGYTVPEGFSNEIDRAMAMWGPMWDANIVRELNTGTGNRLPWPTVDDTAKTGRIKAENANVDDDGTDDVVFAEKQLDAYVYDTGMVKVPLELLTDSAFNMDALLNDLFAERLGRIANTALTTGSGSSQPNGIVTAATSGKTAAATGAVTFDEIIDLFHSVDPAYRQSPKCRWQFNDTTFAAISKLKDGQSNYLWRQGDVRSGDPDLLWNKPYSINQAMANMGASTTPILFGDHSRYVVRKVLGFQLIRLNERYAEAFQAGFVGFKRFDGELLNTAAVKKMTMAAS